MMVNLREELMAEYTLLQGHLESFDAKALTIKSWSTPLLAGGVGLGIEQGSGGFIVMTAIASLSLWLLEAVWKGFQDCYVERTEKLEKWFQDQNSAPLAPFQIYTSWREARHGGLRQALALARRFVQPFIFLPYLPILAACLYFILTVTPKQTG